MFLKKYFIALLLLLCAAGVVFAQAANDPTTVGVGARPLGMGKSFVSISNDPSSIFINPAGLYDLKNPQATSMAGKLLNLVDYFMLGATAPFEKANIGVGYVGSSVAFRSPSFEIVGDIHVPSTQDASYSYSNNAVSIAIVPKNLDFLPKNLYTAGTVKLFSQALSGTSIASLTGSGMEMDLGLIYKLDQKTQIGFCQQNALPASMGGKIKWSDGVEETYPTTSKIGISFKPLLDEKAPPDTFNNDLLLSLDMDLSPTAKIPALWHMGVEFMPTEILDLRAGIDQGLKGNDVANNITAGVGLYLNEFRFDYAYHTYFDLPDNSTHYLSLSYGAIKFPKKETVPEYIQVTSPKNKEIIYTDEIDLKGKLYKTTVFTINSVEVSFNPEDGSFEQRVALLLGKNIFELRAYDAKDRLLETKVWVIPKLLSFIDVGSTFWAKLPIETLATLGIITGYPDGSFRPEKTITRAELTTLMMKLDTGATPEIQSTREIVAFKDVNPKTHWAGKYIYLGVQKGIVTGYPGNKFMPASPITRAEGVAIIARFAGLPKEKVQAGPYPDLPGRHWAAAEVTAAKKAGLLKYLGETNFDPNKPMMRAEAAEILSKTKYASDKIYDLLN